MLGNASDNSSICMPKRGSTEQSRRGMGIQRIKYCVFKQRVWVAGMTQPDFLPDRISGLLG